MKSSDFRQSSRVSDPEWNKTYQDLLSMMLLMAMAVAPAVFILRMILEPRLYTADIVILTLIPVFTFLYFLLRSGRVSIVSLLFLVTAWIAFTVMAAKGVGTRDITVIGYFLVAFIAVLFNGYRVAIIFCMLTLLAVWAMAVAETKGILLPPEENPLVYARDFTLLVVLMITGIVIFARSYRYAYLKKNDELIRRRATEEKLSQNEKRLETENMELLAAKLKAEESDRLKTSFLQNISHEIRTPLNGIVGFSELLKLPDLTEEEESDYIRLMAGCTDNLASMVNDLMEISSIESGSVEETIAEFKTDVLIAGTKKHFSGIAAEKGLRFTSSNTVQGTVIKSDRQKISRILNNLLSNAIKFTRQGEVSLLISRKDNNLLISVTDTGIGIREDDIPKIFDRFRQAEIGTNRSYGGSGLGLAICKGHVEFLGGTVDVESVPGKGSKFTVSVPVTFVRQEDVPTI